MISRVMETAGYTNLKLWYLINDHNIHDCLTIMDPRKHCEKVLCESWQVQVYLHEELASILQTPGLVNITYDATTMDISKAVSSAQASSWDGNHLVRWL